jgi:ferric-dicitrate binding protein FerR (iron transport regulator)
VLIASALVVAASTAVVYVRFAQIDRLAVPVGETVAVVEQIDGSVALARNQTIRVGEWVTTDSGARVALRFSDGTSVRLDVGSRVRPRATNVIELAAGAVYVDTERESGYFEVHTGMATARDLGTQFEVRMLDRAVRLRVRTGVVELNNRTRSVSGRAGTEITLSESGAESRPIASHGSEWDWTAHVSPPVNMEGMSTAAFLEHVAREHGLAVQYADPALAREAHEIILHGSVDGLVPLEMINTAVVASGLQHRFDGGTLLVLRVTRARKSGDAP